MASVDLNTFFDKITKIAETDHGSIPMESKDARERGAAFEDRTYDIGYGHKISEKEWLDGKIHGIPFYDIDKLEFIPLSEAQKQAIAKSDFIANVNLAKNTEGSVWATEYDKVDKQWQMPLMSLAYNVGGSKAGSEWSKVFVAAQAKDIKGFAKGLRRRDGGNNTEGMDNRVVRELYYAGLIESIDDVRAELPLATSINSGVPDKRVKTVTPGTIKQLWQAVK